MVELTRIHEMSKHAGPVYALAEGRSPGMLLSASSDRFIAEWNPQTGDASPFAVKLEEPCFALLFRMDAQLIAAGTGSGNLHIIDLNQKAEIHNFKVHSKGIFAIVHTHDLIIAAGGDGFISVWHPESWKLLRHFAVCDDKLRSLTVDGDRLYAATSGGEIIVFDLPWLNELHRFHAHEGGCFTTAIHPSKPLIVSGGKDGHLRFWHKDENYRPVHAIAAHNFGIYGIAFSPDASMALTASRDKTVKLWSTSDFSVLARIERPKLPGHTHSVNSVKWLDNERFVSAGDDRRILVWKIN